MRRTTLLLASVALTLMAFLALPLASPTRAASPLPVLAFYYPWYNPDDFNRSAMWDVPANPYQSDDPAAIGRHVGEAMDAGVTGFISSWWGQGNRTDRNFAKLLEVSRGKPFSSTIYFEAGAEGLGSEGQVVSALRYVMSSYGGHPNFARVNGKPAIFFWNPGSVGSAATWRGIRSQVDPNNDWHWNVETDRPDAWLDVFDGVHLFSAASWVGDCSATYRNMRSKVDAMAGRTGRPKAWAAGVAPGWDNTRQDNPTKVLVSREGGSYYARRWEAALGSNPDVITVTSWNEWGEGTAIEPGASFGRLYLDITRKYASSQSQATSLPVSPIAGFKLGFAALAAQIPSYAGQPVEDEHYGANGDSLQQTTAGLMVWRKADNWTAFTNGGLTWVNGPNGVQVRPNDQRFPWEAQ